MDTQKDRIHMPSFSVKVKVFNEVDLSLLN
jgi:hypothetical protein